MKQTYTVLHAFRVGAAQRWLKPGDTPALLPCEAQHPLSRGWLEAAPAETKTAAAVAKQKD